MVVLDNCIGSGSVAVACSQTNRFFIGFEKDFDIWQKALKRLENLDKNI